MANVQEPQYSSPDPLGSSQQRVGTFSPSKQQNIEIPISKNVQVETSKDIRLQKFFLTNSPAVRSQSSSPAKVLAQSENPVSPWRIRVTVEADREDLGKNAFGSQGNTYDPVSERTITTKVPLKPADDPLLISPKKARGRPRKSLDSPVKRNGTPKPKTVNRKETTNSSSAKRRELNTPKKSRGRPRKSSEIEDSENTSSRRKTKYVSVQAPPKNEKHDTNSSEQASWGKKRRKNTFTQDKSMPGSEDLEIPEQVNSSLKEPANGEFSNKVDSRKRKHSEALEHEVEISDNLGSSPKSSTRCLFDKTNMNIPKTDKYHDQKLGQYKGGTSTSARGKKRKHLDVNGIDDPTNDHEEFDSIIESEDFSMVSMSSLPFAKLHPHSSNNVENRHSPSIETLPTLVPPLSKAISDQNPLCDIGKSTAGTPTHVRVVRAGITLQDVINPQDAGRQECKRSRVDIPSAKSPDRDFNDLFSGFGASTRRELRAGIRLGEELAKRSQKNPDLETVFTSEDGIYNQSTGSDESGSFAAERKSKIDSPSNHSGLYPVLSNTQLPSPERSETSINEHQTAGVPSHSALQRPTEVNQEHKMVVEEGPDEDAPLNNALIAREEEYQRERDAAIRQMEAANSSQVMFIDSDNDKDDGPDPGACEDSDIWQAEARSPNQQNESSSNSKKLFQNPSSKNRRSHLPSPWRHRVLKSTKRDIDESDRFWQPSQSLRKTNKDEGQEHSTSECGSIPLANEANSLESIGGGYDESCLQQESVIFTSPVDSSLHSTKKVTFSDDQIMLGADSDESYDESSVPPVDEATDEGNSRYKSPVGEAGDRRTPQSPLVSETIVEKVSEAKSKTPATHKHQSSVRQASTWISYLVNFMPILRKSSISKTPTLLPNGNRYLPVDISEGPLGIYTPWTTKHYSALYVHWAAWKEGRANFRLNPRSPSMRYVNFLVLKHRWWRLVEPADVAIADAFMEDLKYRGVDDRQRNHGNLSKRIDLKLVFQKMFDFWVVGVMNGNCEVGSGITGLTLDGKEMWRPELEPWFRGKSSRC